MSFLAPSGGAGGGPTASASETTRTAETAASRHMRHLLSPHSRTVLSELAETACLPSGRLASSRNVRASQTRTVPSKLALRQRLDLGTNATPRTFEVWPPRFRSSLPVPTSQAKTVRLERSQLTAVLPSLLTARPCRPV